MRRAFEELGALYMLHWAENTPGEYTVSADYEVPSATNSRLRRRGDGVSFVSQSRALTLSATGTGPVAMAKKAQAEQIIAFDYDCGSELRFKMKRKDAAVEFGISTIHFVPFDGGVLEYGVGDETALADTTLNAALKMQCEAANAAYSIYWKNTGGKGTVAGSYVTPAHAAELKEKGKKLSFADTSQATVFDMLGESPVAQVPAAPAPPLPLPSSTHLPPPLTNISHPPHTPTRVHCAQVQRTRAPIFIEDAQNCDRDVRKFAAREYGIESICYIPVL